MRAADERRPVSIGSVIRNAVAFNPRNWCGRSVNADALPQAAADLLDLLQTRRIDHVMVGGLAMLQYVAGRNTEDIDLIVAVSALRLLPEIEIIDQNADFARGRFRDLRIDFLLARNQLFDDVRREHSTVRRFEERAIRCATVEGLVLLKLYALPSLYRQGDFTRVAMYEADIATLIQAYRPPLDPLLIALSRHLSDTDLAAVRDILSDIQGRIDRFEQRGGAMLD
jgi:hypothetical protein